MATGFSLFGSSRSPKGFLANGDFTFVLAGVLLQLISFCRERANPHAAQREAIDILELLAGFLTTPISSYITSTSGLVAVLLTISVMSCKPLSFFHGSGLLFYENGLFDRAPGLLFGYAYCHGHCRPCSRFRLLCATSILRICSSVTMSSPSTIGSIGSSATVLLFPSLTCALRSSSSSRSFSRFRREFWIHRSTASCTTLLVVGVLASTNHFSQPSTKSPTVDRSLSCVTSLSSSLT